MDLFWLSCLIVRPTRKSALDRLFLFKTDNPETQPLPNFELLDMQWVLTRLTAMSGAAELDDGYGGDDDDSAMAPCLGFRMIDPPSDWDSDMEDCPFRN